MMGTLLRRLLQGLLLLLLAGTLLLAHTVYFKPLRIDGSLQSTRCRTRSC